MKEVIVAIHQPNFFPWLGYFDKIRRCDYFILLDHVQFPKSEGNWGNRVKLLTGIEELWITAPVNRKYKGLRCFNEMEFNKGEKWREKFIRTLQLTYSRHPYFPMVFPFISFLVSNKDENLVSYNISTIKGISKLLGFRETNFILSSSLPTGAHSTSMLIDLVKKSGGTTYLSGGGAAGYQEDHLFQESG